MHSASNVHTLHNNPILQRLAALVQLARRAREAPSIEALGFVAVNETHQLFGYRQAALARTHAWAPDLPFAVLSVSGLPQADTQAPYTQWLAGVFRSLADPTQTEARAFEANALPDALARDWAVWLPRHALLIPLPGPENRIIGYLLLARDDAWSEHELAVGPELGHAYGHALARFVPTRTWRERIGHALPTKRRWLLALALLAIACCPVRLSVRAPAEVIPLDPFLVRAPLEGVVDRFHVRPNQTVAAGAPLFDLDTTALRSRLSVARKAQDVANEEYRQAAQKAVTDEKSQHELAVKKGRLDESALELLYSQQLLDRVQVKAPRAGIAVFADVNDWQGRAVAIGERVLTLADPKQVELAVSLPAADAIALAPGASITLYPNGSVLDAHEATLTSGAYHAEPTADGVLAYRLKARFASGETPPRIGLMGTAKLRGEHVPLIYYVLRRPLSALRQWLGV